MMMFIRLLIVTVLGSAPLFAEKFTIDPNSSTFEVRQPKKQRVDIFEFAGQLPKLVNIDIDAKKKKNVEFQLTGDCPLLETINYEGTFGILKGKLTGHCPKLALINFLCTSCAMDLDLEADWQQSCEINIQGEKENVVLKLPKNVGLVIHTRTAAKGKVVLSNDDLKDDLKKQNFFGFFKKTYQNELAETAPVLLHISITTTEGHIILK